MRQFYSLSEYIYHGPSVLLSFEMELVTSVQQFLVLVIFHTLVAKKIISAAYESLLLHIEMGCM